MKSFIKQPSEVLDYDVDMTEWFESIPGDDIESVTITVTSITEDVPTLVIGPTPHNPYYIIGANPTVFKVWVGGGTEFEDYVVTCVVTTEQDRKKEVEFKIKVRDK